MAQNTIVPEPVRTTGEPVVDVPGAIAKTEAALIDAIKLEATFTAMHEEAGRNLQAASANVAVLRRLRNSLVDYWNAVAPAPEARELRRPPVAPPVAEEDLQLGTDQ